MMKGQAEPERVNRQQGRATNDRGLGSGNRQNRCQNRSDARRPTERKREPHDIGAPKADRLSDIETGLSVQ